ncbi:helicase associated domain-containing protein [Streptomyces prasinus]
MCEHILRIEPAREDEKPKPRTSQADKWAMNYQAARQFYEREGHLRVPREHIERIIIDGEYGSRDGESREGQEAREVRLGTWVGNQRSRAATLSPDRIEQLSAIGMRWA